MIWREPGSCGVSGHWSSHRPPAGRCRSRHSGRAELRWAQTSAMPLPRARSGIPLAMGHRPGGHLWPAAAAWYPHSAWGGGRSLRHGAVGRWRI